MPWLAIAAVVAGIYTAEQNRRAQAEANASNRAIAQAALQQQSQLTGEGLEVSAQQFDILHGEAETNRREREAALNDIIQGQFTELQAENVSRLDPFAQAGRQATTEQAALLGLRGAEEEQAAIERIRESPGQEFLRKRQERSLLRSSAAIGGLGGGNVRTALQEQAYQRAQQSIDERAKMLQNLGGQGLVASQTLAQLNRPPAYLTTGTDIGVTATPTAPSATAPTTTIGPPSAERQEEERRLANRDRLRRVRESTGSER